MKVTWTRLSAEAFGTFALVLAGTGAVAANEFSGGAVGHVGIGLTFGLVVMALIYAIGDVSGAHINPAVTIGFFVARRFEGRWVLPYITAQCIGAVAASFLLRGLLPGVVDLGATVPALGTTRSFVVEVVLTWILMLVILRVSLGARETGIMAGAAVGATVGVEALFAGPFTGASMNPARSLGPALATGATADLWIYLAAPILGALCAVPACLCIQGSGCCGPSTLEENRG